MDIYSDIKLTMDHIYTGFKFDDKLIEKIQWCADDWATRDAQHTEFLGSGLVGTHKINFTAEDDEKVSVSIFNKSLEYVQDEVYKVEQFDKTWKLKSSAFYITLFYFIHRFVISALPYKKKEQAILGLFRIFSYKTLGSIYNWYFRSETSREVAIVVSENMEMKFILKKEKTWAGFIHYRAINDIMPPDGYHTDRLTTFSSLDCIKIIEDTRNRFKSVIKNVYPIILEVIADKTKLQSKSQVIEGGEGAFMRGITDRPDTLLYALDGLLITDGDFLDRDVLSIVVSVLYTVDKSLLLQALKITRVSFADGNNRKLLETMFRISISYINRRGITANYTKHFHKITTLLKGFWSSGNIPDKDFSVVKNEVFKLCVSGMKGVNRTNKANLVIGIIMYLFVRPLHTRE